ncbi:MULTISPECIES: serine/threonine protein kinase [unclassified Moraxella]|uniref:serine/threonine protein kinase n=1 Tax=unclassified Moraxella TaxID=2685852 RepID=UPI003AF6BEB9
MTMNKPLQTQEFLAELSAKNLPIADLTLLADSNPRNATQLYHGQWLSNSPHSQAQSIFIKRLIAPISAIHYSQFCQEIKTLQACQTLAIDKHNPPKSHYGIPQLLAYATEKDNAFLILPFYQGQTLKTLLQQNSLTFEQKIIIAIRLCQLIQDIHCLGYLHGDMKPSNILLTEYQQVILLDFGLSQSLTTTALRTSDFTAGTPAYMSPEQFNGLPLTAQSDCYSLGIVLFEMFTGQKPFFATELHDWAVAHCQQPMPRLPLITTDRALQQTLQRIIDGLTAKFPQQRFANLADIHTLLMPLLMP